MYNQQIITEEILTLIEELTLNYFFSEEVVTFDIDNFINGKKNILFITGVTSAGKTTSSKLLKNTFEFDVFNLDNEINYISKSYRKEKFEFKINIFYYRILKKIEKYENTNKKLLIEGIQLFEYFYVLHMYENVKKNFEEKLNNHFLNNSIAILNTGLIKTLIRDKKRTVREIEYNLMSPHEGKYKNLIVEKYLQRKDLKKYIQLVMENYKKEQIKKFEDVIKLINYIEDNLY